MVKVSIYFDELREDAQADLVDELWAASGLGLTKDEIWAMLENQEEPVGFLEVKI